MSVAMRRRVRLHLGVSLFGAALGLVLMVGLVAYSQAHYGAHSPPWLLVVVGLAFLAIPAVGLTSAFTLVRCPACRRSVIWLVSANFSLYYGRNAPKTCGGCGARLFPDDMTGRTRRVFVILFAVGAIIALLRLAWVVAQS